MVSPGSKIFEPIQYELISEVERKYCTTWAEFIFVGEHGDAPKVIASLENLDNF